MEGDDGAVAAVVYHIPEDIEGIEIAGVVTRHEIPHHDGVTLLHEQMVCAEPHPSMRRTEQRHVGDGERTVLRPHSTDVGSGLHHGIRRLDVGEIGPDVVFQRTHVVVGMVADAVSLADDATEQVRIALHILTDNEEGGLHAMFLEGIKNKRC